MCYLLRSELWTQWHGLQEAGKARLAVSREAADPVHVWSVGRVQLVMNVVKI